VYFDSGMTKMLLLAMELHLYISSSAICNASIKVSWVLLRSIIVLSHVFFFATGRMVLPTVLQV
jgi:hypothetical protein